MNQSVWNWNAGKRALYNDNKVVDPEEIGYCSCNRTTLRNIQNVTDDSNLTIGVPDEFVKDGMATFYVQLVIGGRKTSDPEEGCACKGPDDTSDACMCMLGTKKIPYIYNNSFIPYFTALVAIKNGGLIYTNTYIKYNFDANGMGERASIPVCVCVSCLCLCVSYVYVCLYISIISMLMEWVSMHASLPVPTYFRAAFFNLKRDKFKNNFIFNMKRDKFKNNFIFNMKRDKFKNNFIFNMKRDKFKNNFTW